MLTSDANAKVAQAVEPRINKAGALAVKEVEAVVIAQITSLRTAFLDLEPAGEVKAPEAQGRAIDLAPEPETKADLTGDAWVDENRCLENEWRKPAIELDAPLGGLTGSEFAALKPQAPAIELDA